MEKIFYRARNVNFYSHTSCEVRLPSLNLFRSLFLFLLTHLMRGATELSASNRNIAEFLLTHLMRGATKRKISYVIISCISTHTPHARCDRGVNVPWLPSHIFLLTHLMRGATHTINLMLCS